MAQVVEVRPLHSEDERGSFSCGQPDLDRFFKHYAGQNQFKHHIALTYVATGDEQILGFATVSAASLEQSSLPDARLRRRPPAYPLPALRLARLGVDTRVQGCGIGNMLLRHVLRLAVEQRDALGYIGVVTDAKPDAVPFYETLGFVPLTGVRQGALHGEPTPMFLSIETIQAAVK